MEKFIPSVIGAPALYLTVSWTLLYETIQTIPSQIDYHQIVKFLKAFDALDADFMAYERLIFAGVPIPMHQPDLYVHMYIEIYRVLYILFFI